MGKGKFNSKIKYSIIAAVALLVLYFADIPAMFSTVSNGNHLTGDTADPVFQIDIHDMDEYNKFVQTCKYLPDNFITWDMVESFGYFYAFKCYSSTDISQYNYLIDLENGEKIELEINPSFVYEDKALLSVKEISETMLKTATNTSGRYVNEGLTYQYLHGDLNCIEWTANGNLVRLNYLTCTFSELASLSTNTIVGKLLSTSSDNQTAAFNQLIADVENNQSASK